MTDQNRREFGLLIDTILEALQFFPMLIGKTIPKRSVFSVR
jgi:hypothetical protein